jgi:hypothetical protein
LFHVKQFPEHPKQAPINHKKPAYILMAKLKLTREQIREGLEQIPMKSLLRGATGSEVNLTAKQIAFAKELALGKTTKAGAYRKVYNTKAQPRTVSSNAAKLSTDQRIALAVESFRQAEAYKEYQTPAQLRQLVVSQLTQHVLDPDFPPAQRVQCLKLLGSVAEIGLFVDRKETLVVHQSSEIRERLLSQLKNVIDTQATDITPNDDADSLLDEINSAKKPDNDAAHEEIESNVYDSQDSDPTVPPPPDFSDDHPVLDIHTIPHEAPVENSIPHESQNSIPHEDPPGGETKQSLEK